MAHQFTQFFDYSAKDIPIEDFTEFFALAKANNEFWDMLAGSIYHYNPAVGEFLLNNHNYLQYMHDKDFIELLSQSLYQIDNIEGEDAESIRMLIKNTFRV